MKSSTLRALLDAKAAKKPTALATDLESGTELLWADGETQGELALTDGLKHAILTALADDKGRTEEVDGKRYFINVFNPPKRLIIVGAVHIAQALAPMATLAGYAVSVIDPRHSFGTDERFPGIELIDEWPDDALTALDPDRRTAIVTLTHDPKLDDPALTVALGSDAFYIGALGSRRTHAKRVERLTAAGVPESLFDRIDAPVGLDIGAVSPAEIAIATLASITTALHRPRQEKAA